MFTFLKNAFSKNNKRINNLSSDEIATSAGVGVVGTVIIICAVAATTAPFSTPVFFLLLFIGTASTFISGFLGISLAGKIKEYFSPKATEAIIEKSDNKPLNSYGKATSTFTTQPSSQKTAGHDISVSAQTKDNRTFVDTAIEKISSALSNFSLFKCCSSEKNNETVETAHSYKITL